VQELLKKRSGLANSWADWLGRAHVSTSLDLTQPQQPYQFVGGPFDGRTLSVAPPPEDGTELVVHTVGHMAPAEFYILQRDGRFHYNAPPRAGAFEALLAD
jgi:hypothetical protein